MPAIALYGSGEFLPWSRPVDDWCLETSSVPGDRVLVLPTASAPEGDDVFDRWARMGVAHYERMGLAPEVLDVRARADAERADVAARVEGARLLFFSGGNPGYLASTMAGTPLWDAIRAAVAHGAALAGCSAGAVFLGALAPDVAGGSFDGHWVQGVELLADAFIMPHYDALDSYQPGLRDLILGFRPARCASVGIDEDTALCGDGERWCVFGRGAVSLGGTVEPSQYQAGDAVTVHLGLRLP